MWLMPLRPDVHCSTKELSRVLQAPTEEGYARMKHWIKFRASARNYECVISLGDRTTAPRTSITSYVDPAWAGRKATRASIAGVYCNAMAYAHVIGRGRRRQMH